MTTRARPRRSAAAAPRLGAPGVGPPPTRGGWSSAPAIALLILTVVGSAAVARGEVIELTTGERITGTVKGTTKQGLVIVVKGRRRTIPHRLIAGIEFGPPGLTARPGAPAVESVAAPSPNSEALEPPESTRRVRRVATPGPEPDLATLAPPTLREAMQAVLELRASTAANPSLEDYAARTQEARTRVDRYVGDASDRRAAVKQALTSAMRFYAAAASAWSTFDSKRDFAAVGREPALAACPHLRQTIEHDAAQWKFNAADPAFVGLMAGTEGIEDLWACASDKLNEAQALLAGGKPAAAR